MKAGAYIRVSQDTENPENQRHAIREYARSHGIQVVKYFEDIGVSGGVETWQRPAFRSMIQYARKHGIRVIIFYDLTRLSRSFLDGLNTFHKLLEEGYNIITVSGMPINIDNPVVRNILLSVIFAFAEWYRLDIAERTRQGIRRARSEGKRIGRPPAPCRAVIRLREAGLSYSEIRKELGISKATIWRCLKRFQNQF